MIGDAPIVSGEMHYARVPREYWRARLQMAYAMGLDAVSTYVFWNLHEPHPGVYNFSEQNDVAEYVRLAAACGLDVILRPGPYVCAEWDFGGLPAWLLTIPELRIRTADETFMSPVRRWLKRLGDELAPLQRAYGGPIVAVQLENEYGAFGKSAEYLCALRAVYDDAGFDASPYYTIDQPLDLERGCLPDLPIATTFGPGNLPRGLATMRALRAQARPVCGEYWAGWFDRWGEPHQKRDDGQQVRDLAWMLNAGCSVNLYMVCGGTNFGFTNGANGSADEPYAPVTTSYDYLAAIDEAGRPTPKYFGFREAIARQRGTPTRALPPIPNVTTLPACRLEQFAPLADLLTEFIETELPLPMERCGQSFGFVLYRTKMPHPGSGVLDIEELRDYATVLLDGRILGYLDRRLRQSSIRIDVPKAGSALEILVENCGRINYGPRIDRECKGITHTVRFNGTALRGWRLFSLPFDDLSALGFSYSPCAPPAFYRGILPIERPRDAFLDTSSLGKGVLFVNGHNAGRYWRIGPQRSLFVPGAWLREGHNELVAFDVMPLEAPSIRGAERAVGD
jgi:beta-galactosidase